MRIITLTTQKGGSGKSTLVASLAVAAEEAGERVFILDLDRQGTTRKWIDRRTAETPGFDTVSDEPQLHRALELLSSQDFTLVLIDTPGSDTPLVTAAIRAADLNLIPARPTPADLEATEPTIQAIQGTGKRLAFILNQTAQKHSSRASDASKGLRMLGIVAEPSIVQRADHQDALGMGQGVTEFNPEGKAAAEIRALWKWINNRMKA